MRFLICETSTLLGSVAVVENMSQAQSPEVTAAAVLQPAQVSQPSQPLQAWPRSSTCVLSSKELFRQGSHSDVLNTLIQQVLKEAQLQLHDIDCFVTGLGPGSFTGLRISLNTIKTFGYVYNKPVWGGDSLKTMAFQAWQKIETTKIKTQCSSITVLINAYKNMVYAAQYTLNDSVAILYPPQVVRVQNLKDFIRTETYVVGDGYLAYKDYLLKNASLAKYLVRENQFNDYPTASSLGQLAAQVPPQDFLSWHVLLPLYLRASEAEENRDGIKYQALD